MEHKKYIENLQQVTGANSFLLQRVANSKY